MNFIVFLIIGLIAGVIGKAIMPGTRNEPSGWLMTIVLGIVGAYVGGFLGGLFNLGANGFIGQIIMASIGAIIVIGLLRLFSSRRAV
jgi:uncharacterized membrane protein YeaQ/YmgE (transglycosylase-associated protein family)